MKTHSGTSFQSCSNAIENLETRLLPRRLYRQNSAAARSRPAGDEALPVLADGALALASTRAAIAAYAEDGLSLMQFRSFKSELSMTQSDLGKLSGGQLVLDRQADPIGVDAARLLAPLREAERYTALLGLMLAVELESAAWVVWL